MKCPKCNNDFEVRIASKALTKNCRLLSNMTTVLTIQCEKCNAVFQVPVQGQNVFSVKKEKEE